MSTSGASVRTDEVHVDRAAVRRAALGGLVGTALERRDSVICGTAAAIVVDPVSSPDVVPAVGVPVAGRRRHDGRDRHLRRGRAGVPETRGRDLRLGNDAVPRRRCPRLTPTRGPHG